jgi:putative ABC transport system permease protein
MDEIVSQSMSAQTFSTALLGIFVGIALLLAAVGIYGVIAYSTGRRSLEIGCELPLVLARRT